MDLSSLKDDLAKTIAGKTTCLYFSGGSDSLLLLHVLLDMKANFSIMTFDATFSPEQKKLIDDVVYEQGLRVFSYKPANAYFIGDGEKLAFVEEYGFLDGTLIPFVRDCTGGTKCSFDVMVETRPDVPIGFEVNIFGTRKTDRHWSWGSAALQSRKRLEHGIVWAPLWAFSRADVIAGLKEYGVKKPKVDTGSYQHCTACLEGKGEIFCPKTQQIIDPVDWKPTVMLDAFRTKFNVKTLSAKV